MEEKERNFNEMQTVKRRFYAMRNGVIADVLRRNGCCFKIIFGLNLPQIAEIAAETPHSGGLAEALWANSTTRESMLMAPMLVDSATFSREDAMRWIGDIRSREVADVLCLKLLRKTPYALELARELASSDDAMKCYTGLRLMFNLVGTYPHEACMTADETAERTQDSYLKALAKSLKEESEYLLG